MMRITLEDLHRYIDTHYIKPQDELSAPLPLFHQETENDILYDSVASPFSHDAALYISSSTPMPTSAPMPSPAPAKKKTVFPIGLRLPSILDKRESSFSEFLRELLKERKEKDSEIYKRAEVSKQLFSKILSTKDYQPTKSTAVELAIGLQLDLNQTQKLLEKAGYTLTRSSKTDLVVQYCIEREIYSISFINEALYDCGLPLLKTGLKV